MVSTETAMVSRASSDPLVHRKQARRHERQSDSGDGPVPGTRQYFERTTARVTARDQSCGLSPAIRLDASIEASLAASWVEIQTQSVLKHHNR